MSTGFKTVEAARNGYDNENYYSRKLEEARIFQDVVAMECYKRGLVLVNINSTKFQYEKGENLLGAEIKLDRNFRTTGNLYIEVAEKAHPSRRNYTPSGICRDDNSWLFIIGDEVTFYVFSRKTLLRFHKRFAARNQIKETPTSRGFLFPVKYADEYAEFVVYPTLENVS